VDDGSDVAPCSDIAGGLVFVVNNGAFTLAFAAFFGKRRPAAKMKEKLKKEHKKMQCR